MISEWREALERYRYAKHMQHAREVARARADAVAGETDSMEDAKPARRRKWANGFDALRERTNAPP